MSNKLNKKNINGLTLLLVLTAGALFVVAVLNFVLMLVSGVTREDLLELGDKILWTYFFTSTVIVIIYLSGKHTRAFKHISTITSMLLLGILCINLAQYYESYKAMSKWLHVYTDEAAPYWNSNLEEGYKEIPVDSNMITAPIIIYKRTLNYIIDISKMQTTIENKALELSGVEDIEVIDNMPSFYKNKEVKDYLGMPSFEEIDSFEGTVNDFNLKAQGIVKSGEYINDIPEVEKLLQTLTNVIKMLAIAICVVILTVISHKQNNKISLYYIVNKILLKKEIF